ncbi:hypothetical protein [Campylobacter concisus]|uniref:hypothetical protein n=1 Tax=Campylobacter concisus TaxID=199 RepID=UPI00112F7F53|nr:hypothetical protein [Campylobacter concisus]
MDQQTITSFMSLLAIFVSFYTAYNVKNIEREKSKLKKVEILFNMQVEAAKEFNKIYHELSPLNLGDVHDGEFYGKTQWGQIRSRISKYQADYAYLFDDDEIIKKLEDIMLSLDFVTYEYAFLQESEPDKARELEERQYIDTLSLIADANNIIKRYMIRELNNN